jgi:hypothetical protein
MFKNDNLHGSIFRVYVGTAYLVMLEYRELKGSGTAMSE